MAGRDLAQEQLLTLVADAIASGDYDATHHMNPDEFDGFYEGAVQAVTAMMANPDVVLRAMGGELLKTSVGTGEDGSERPVNWWGFWA